MDLQPSAIALPCVAVSPHHECDGPAGFSLADELHNGVSGGLCQTDPQKNLCVIFQEARGEEKSLLAEENTRKAEKKPFSSRCCTWVNQQNSC